MSKILIDEADLNLVMDALVEAQNIDDSGEKWDRNKKAIDILGTAQPERPYEIGARLAREGKGISDICGAVDSNVDMAEAQRGYNEALAERPAPEQGGHALQDLAKSYIPEDEAVVKASHAKENVKRAMISWRQSFVNMSGDQAGLHDYMDQETISDLIDFVCEKLAPRPGG